MKNTAQILLFAVAGTLAFVASMSAHHAFDSEFDLSRPVHLEGRISRVEWKNPHVFVDVDVPGGAKTSPVRVELTSISKLALAGWSSRTLQAGMEIVVEGFAAKVSSPMTVGTTSLTIKATGQALHIAPADWHHSFSQK